MKHSYFHLFGHARIRPVLLVVSTLVLVVVIVSVSGHELGDHIQSLEVWITQLGLLGMLAFVGLVVLGTTLFLPESLFGVAAGVLFGFVGGTAVIVLANILAAVLQYGLAHRLLREPIQRKLQVGKMSAAIQRVANGGNFKLQLLLRLAPVNQTIISYSLGAAGIRFSHFLAATIAMLPSIIIEVYLGHTGKHVALASTGAGHSGWHHTALLLTGLVAAIIGIGLASKAAHKRVVLHKTLQNQTNGMQ